MSFATKFAMMTGFGDDYWGRLANLDWYGSTTSPVSNYYDIQSTDIGGQSPAGFYMRENGESFFIVEGNEAVRRWDMSTPYDLTTASFNKSLGQFSDSAAGLYFKPDGTRVFMLGNQNNKIFRRSLTTAWTTMQTLGQPTPSANLTSYNKNGLFFKPDGSSLWFTANYNVSTTQTRNIVFEYSCGTAWDVNDISQVRSENFNFSGFSNGDYEPFRSIDFKPDGTKMYIVRETASANVLMEYPLGSAWNISTAGTPRTKTLPTDLQDCFYLRMKYNGTEAFLVDQQSNGHVFKLTES